MEGALVLSLCSEALPVSSLASTGWAMADVGELQALVQKERATSRDNLKKVMAISKEKKDVEAQLSAQAAAAGQLQAEAAALRAKVSALEGELEETKEELGEWQEEAEASASQLEAARRQLGCRRLRARRPELFYAPLLSKPVKVCAREAIHLQSRLRDPLKHKG